MTDFKITPLADTVQRCALRWDPEEYLWLSPGDRDEWLEVSVRTFEEAKRIPAEVAEILRHDLDGIDANGKPTAGIPIRATRAWLEQQGKLHQGATFD